MYVYVLAHSWPVHPLTHLPRADTGICLFYCQNIKANSQRGSSTTSRVACHQGAAYFDRFRQSWGWQLCHNRTYLSTQQTYKHVPVWVRVCASWQPLSLGLCRQTYLHMLAAYFNKSCWISCRTDSRYTQILTHTHTSLGSMPFWQLITITHHKQSVRPQCTVQNLANGGHKGTRRYHTHPQVDELLSYDHSRATTAISRSL